MSEVDSTAEAIRYREDCQIIGFREEQRMVNGRKRMCVVGQCEGCGKPWEGRRDYLKMGVVKACRECTHTKIFGTPFVFRNLRLYNVHVNIVQRTTNPRCAVWARYGGRGILLADDLRSFADFFNFCKTLDRWPEGGNDLPPPLTIDRIDNDLGYQKGNLRIATMQEQCHNRSSNAWETIGDRTMIRMDWYREFPLVHQTTVERRMAMGWSFEDALMTPSRNESAIVKYNGEDVSIAELARITGKPYNLLRKRIRGLGWDVDRAVSEPSIVGRRRARPTAPAL